MREKCATINLSIFLSGFLRVMIRFSGTNTAILCSFRLKMSEEITAT